MNSVSALNGIKQNPLTYRKKLTIPSKINFGLEIELENVDYEKVLKYIYDTYDKTWKVYKDLTLKKDSNAELSSPVLQNKKETWIMIKNIANYVKSLNPTFENCSFQINFDEKLLDTSKKKILFMKIFAYYENIIYRFSKGENEEYRNTLTTFAYPIILHLKDCLTYSDEHFIIDKFTNSKRNAINFKNSFTEKLIEIRTPNGTANEALWQNYITFFYYLINYANNPKINENELDEYIKKFNITYLLEYYEKLKFEKAIELANKIYKNKTDQLYFIDQYIGYEKVLKPN